MKFTMTSALVAALAAVSSAAAIGSIAVEAPLPAKFTLKVTTPTPGTALEKYLGQVTVDHYGSQFLNIGTGSNQQQIPVIAFKKGDSGAYVENMDNLGNWDLTISGTGDLRFWAGLREGNNLPFTGFTQLNGALAFTPAGGKGPQTLWTACRSSWFTNLWNVYYSPATTLSDCIPIGLTIVPL